MADKREIIITLKTEGSEVTKTSEPQKADTGDVGNKTTKTAIAAFAVKELTATLVSETLNWANYEIDKNLTLSDDYIHQRNKNIAMQLINKTASTASTIFNSTAFGAMLGGPIGAAFGAVIGGIATVSSTTREILQASEQQDIRLAQMGAQLGYTRKRSGWSTTAASIGEDL